MKWAEAIHSENPPGNTIHVALDDYSPGDVSFKLLILYQITYWRKHQFRRKYM